MLTSTTTIHANRGGAWGVTMIGVVLVGTAVAYGVRVGSSSGQLYPKFDAVVLLALASVVVGTGYWLGQSEIEGPELWRIATAVGLGIILMAGLTGWQLLVQARQGLVIEAPMLSLAVTQTVGATAGLLVGIYHVHSIRRARQVREARERTRKAQESQKQLRFVTHLLRHHLCNGIQVIRSHAGFLEGHVDKDGERYRETIERRSNRLVGLLENMQILIESYETPGGEPVALDETLQNQATAVEQAYPDASVTVGDRPDLTVEADALLGVVFETLLSSAIERTGITGPTVGVAVEREEKRAVVSVDAPGPELDDGVETLLFERAELRESSDRERLGFYVADRLVTAYGGDLTVDGQHEGPRYVVELPLAS